MPNHHLSTAVITEQSQHLKKFECTNEWRELVATDFLLVDRWAPFNSHTKETKR